MITIPRNSILEMLTDAIRQLTGLTRNIETTEIFGADLPASPKQALVQLNRQLVTWCCPLRDAEIDSLDESHPVSVERLVDFVVPLVKDKGIDVP